MRSYKKAGITRIYRGQWRFEWEGGRLADVFHKTKAVPVDCVEVTCCDCGTSATKADLETAADAWVRDNTEDYTRELPWLP